ncbi:MAG: hypothetical protein OHK0053_11300 [Microscillaceae bacterium]
MEILDWLVLLGSTFGIVWYGLWKSRGEKNIDDYLKGGHSLPWYTISLSVIATQASAITFLSAPGQAYVDGMRFVLFYLGLPIAMVVISAVMVPLYYRLNVITAYEFLESRLDLKSRVLTAFFFLIQRGLAAGVSIAAPAIVLSVVLNLNITIINFFIGLVVVLYTVMGGSRAVSQTQKLQMITILGGMAWAGYLVIALLPKEVGWEGAMYLAAQTDKFNTMDFSFDLDNRYTLWSGLLGGFFLQMAYFGTDQSQVGRYLGGTSLRQIRLGLLFNGVFKIPMQFAILYIGAMLFVFYQFQAPPLIFNTSVQQKIAQNGYNEELRQLEQKQKAIFQEREAAAQALLRARNNPEKEIALPKQRYLETHEAAKALRAETGRLIQKAEGQAPTAPNLQKDLDYMNNIDANYIFLSFVTRFLPAGLVGLLIAVILMASMSTTASELNALASTSTIDIYKRLINPKASEKHYLNISRLLTLFWGGLAILFAQLASHLGTLIEAVNILGSLFYGTILGIFLLAFWPRRVSGHAAFGAAILTEILVILVYLEFLGFKIAYLWLNMLGCGGVVLFALFLETLRQGRRMVR